MHALPVQGEAKLVLERAARRQAEVGADRFPGAVDLQFQVLLLGHTRAVEHLDGGLKGNAGNRCRAGEGDRLQGHVGRRFAVHVDNDHGGWSGTLRLLRIVLVGWLFQAFPGEGLVVGQDVDLLAGGIGLGKQVAGLLELGRQVGALVTGPALVERLLHGLVSSK